MGSGSPIHSLVAFVRTVLGVVRDEKVSFMAGSLAYYAFVSLLPLTALAVFAVTVVGIEPLVARVVTLTGSPLSPELEAILRWGVFGGGMSGAIGASIVGVVTALWGAVKLLGGLNTAFTEIYDTRGKPSLVDRLVDAAVVLVSVPAALVAVSLTTLVLSVVTVHVHVHIAAPLFLVGGLTVVFLPLYYVFPDTDVSVREILPGVVVAAVGWVLLQQLFRVYVHLVGASVGGAVGAVILSLTWLYFAGVVLLVGCTVNAVYGGHRGRLTERRRRRWRWKNESGETPVRTDGDGTDSKRQ